MLKNKTQVAWQDNHRHSFQQPGQPRTRYP